MTRPGVARTISFDSKDSSDLPSTSEHRRRRPHDENGHERKHGDGDRKKSHGSGRRSPKRSRSSRRAVRPGDVSEAPSFDLGTPKSPRQRKHHSSSRASHPSKPRRTKSGSAGSDKRVKSRGDRRAPSRSRSNREPGNKKLSRQESAGAATFSGYQLSRQESAGAATFSGYSKHLSRQESVSGSTFSGSEEPSLQFSAVMESARKKRDSESALSKSGTLLSESVRTGFDVDTPTRAYPVPPSPRNSNQKRANSNSNTSVAESSAAESALEGLSEEQKVWAGIARVLEAYGDNGSVATRDVLPASVMKALSDSYSSFNGSVLPLERSERTSKFPGALPIDENKEQDFGSLPASSLNQGRAPPGIRNVMRSTSFSSIVSDLQSYVGPDGKATIDPNSNQEENLKLFMNTVATMVTKGGALSSAPNGNKGIFNMFSWDQQKQSCENRPEDGDKKSGESSRNDYEGRSKSSPSPPSGRKKNGALEKHESNRPPHKSSKTDIQDNEDADRTDQNASSSNCKKDSPQGQGSPVSDEEIAKSAGVDPLLVAVNMGSLRGQNESEEYQGSMKITDLDLSAQVDDGGDESYDRFDSGGPCISPGSGPKHKLSSLTSSCQLDHELQHPRINVHEEGNNSMPSLSTFQEPELRVTLDEMQDKHLSYGDLGYEEANDGGPLSPVATRQYPANSPKPSPRIQNSPLARQVSPFSPFKKHLKKSKLKTGKREKIKKGKIKKEKKKSPSNSTASTDLVDDLSSPDDFNGFFPPEAPAIPGPEVVKPKSSRLPRLPGLNSLLRTPHKTPHKKRFKDPAEQTTMAHLRRGVMKLPFFTKKKREAAVFDTGSRDAQFYPDQEESEHGLGSLLD